VTPSVADELLALGTATLGESGAAVLHPRLKAVWPGARLAAPAFTVQCPAGDNLAVHVAVAEAPPGAALVVDGTAEPARGYWGEVLTTAAEARGLTGLVLDGGVRDVDALAAHRFPVFSALVALRGAAKEAGGTVGGPVTVGDVEVRTGDWVVADTDGVVVIAAADLDAVLSAARTRAEKEQGLFTALRAGQTTIELLGLEKNNVRRA